VQRNFDSAAALVLDATVAQRQAGDTQRVLLLGKPLRPHMPMLSGTGTLLVSTELAQALSIVDLQEGKIVGQIPTGAKESHVFVRTPDGRKIYTVNLHAGSISVLDVTARRLVKVIQVSSLVNRISLSGDGKSPFVSDGSSPNVILINTTTDEVTRKIPVAAPPFSLSFTPDGKWLLVGEDLGTKGKLEALDLASLHSARHRPRRGISVCSGRLSSCPCGEGGCLASLAERSDRAPARRVATHASFADLYPSWWIKHAS